MIGLVLSASMALLPAHPLGNFSVNQLVSLSLHPDRVEAVAILDLAELPTLQFTPDCADVARDISVTVDGKRLKWTIASTDRARRPGAAGLDTTRITCHLTAPAKLDGPAEIDVTNTYLPERLGWHELTATGQGVQVTGLPSASVTDQLRSYPDDLLSSPLDVRSAHLRAQPGSTSDTPLAAAATTSSTGLLGRAEQWLQSTVGDRGITPLVGLLAVLLAMVLGAGHAALPGHGKTVMAVYLAGRAGRPRDALIVGATVTATHTGGVLALGLLLTGAASLAGETVLGWLGIASGALVIAVGASMLVTTLRSRGSAHGHGHTHASGLGHAATQASGIGHATTHSSGSGHAARLAQATVHGHGHSHAHDHDHTHDHEPDQGPAHEHNHRPDQGHAHVPGHVHGHGHEPDHVHVEGAENHGAHARHDDGGTQDSGAEDQDAHEHRHEGARTHGHHPHGHHHGHHHGHSHAHGHSHGRHHHHRGPGHGHGRRAQLTALGIAGGLVPSPSALIVLLGAIALGRTGFGILLVLAYGLGMAATLTAAGLTLLKLRDRLQGRWHRLTRLAPAAPYATGGLVLVVGLGLAARAATLVV